MKKLKILMVAYRFAPESATGSLRSIKFAKYLSRKGHDVTVLTVSNPPKPAIDTSTLDDIGIQVKTIRTPKCEPSRITALISRLLPNKLKNANWRVAAFLETLLYPDLSALWIPGALIKGSITCKNNKYDVIYSSYAPAGTHITAMFLSKIFSIPWVADYRDLWAHEFEYVPRNRIHGWLDKKLERSFIKNAQRSIFVSKGCMQRMLKAYPEYNYKFKIILNGYDHEDSNYIEHRPFEGEIVLTHVGTLYSSRTIQHFIDAADKLIDEAPDLKNIIKIEQLGPVNINSLSTRNVLLASKGWQPREIALDSICNAQVCLLPLHSADGGSDSLPQKVYEYLAFGKIILATGKRGCQAEKVLENYPNCYFVEDGNTHALQETLKKVINKIVKDPSILDIKRESVHQFSRLHLTQQLTNEFEELLK